MAAQSSRLLPVGSLLLLLGSGTGRLLQPLPLVAGMAKPVPSAGPRPPRLVGTASLCGRGVPGGWQGAGRGRSGSSGPGDATESGRGAAECVTWGRGGGYRNQR